MKWLGVLVLLCMLPTCVAAVTLAWDYTQGTDPAVLFRVYREIPSGGTCDGSWQVYGEVPVNTQFFADNAISAGQTYCYKVTAVDGQGGESTSSNVVSFQVSAQTLAPPSNLRGTVN